MRWRLKKVDEEPSVARDVQVPYVPRTRLIVRQDAEREEAHLQCFDKVHRLIGTEGVVTVSAHDPALFRETD